MWRKAEKAPILEFIGWLILISVISNTISFLFENDYSAGLAGGEITAGYIIYVLNGILIDTPTPLIATSITLLSTQLGHCMIGINCLTLGLIRLGSISISLSR